MYVVCIINEIEYYKRLTINGLQVSFYIKVYNFWPLEQGMKFEIPPTLGVYPPFNVLFRYL